MMKLSSIFRQMKATNILNILGLAIAYAAFMMIMMQIYYNQSFDKCYPQSQQLYRVDRESINNREAIISRPLADVVFASSPHIVAATLVESGIGNFGEYFVSAESRKGQTGFIERCTYAYPNFPEVIGFEMIWGNRNVLDIPRTVLIPQSVAKKIFGKDSGIEEQIYIGTVYYNVGGVYKDFPSNSSIRNDIYFSMGDANINAWENSNYFAYVRIDDPKFIPDIIEDIKKNRPENNENTYFVFNTLNDLHFMPAVRYDVSAKTSKEAVLVLWTIAFALLIIGSINFVNFSIAKAPKRVKVINTKMILGAYKLGIRNQLILEAILTSFFAFLFSIIIVWFFSYTSVSGLIDGGIDISVSKNIIVLSAVISLIGGLLSGIYPAHYTTSFQPALAIKGGIASTPKGKALRNGLIGIQFVASFVLVICVFIMYSQFHYMQNLSLGYNKDQIIITDLNTEMAANRKTLTNELKTFSGIEEVTYSETLLGASDAHMGWGRQYGDRFISFSILPVDPSFLKVMDISVVDGRDFREDDSFHLTGKYIFNQKARSEYGLELNTYIQEDEIIGFIQDVQFTSFYSAPEPMAFYVWGTDNWGERMRNAYIKVKAGSDMNAVRSHIQKTFSKLDSEYPFSIRFYEEALEKAYQKDKRTTQLITLFSLITILISLMGVFGLIIFETEHRRKEVSIRKVIGSSVGEILKLFTKTYLIILGICFVIACPLAYIIGRKWLNNFAFTTELHFWLFLAGGLVMLCIVLTTILIQSYKAATENPANILKSE